MKLCESLSGPGALRLMLSLLVFADHLSRYNFGTTSVYLFFILSGFWITSMWERKYSRAFHPYRTFVISRFWRIYPVFALSALLAVFSSVISGRFDSQKGSIARLLFENLLLLGGKNVFFAANPPAWSLDVEAQFYLIAPLIIGLLRNSFWWIAAIFLLCLVSIERGDALSVMPYIMFFTAGSMAAMTRWMPGKLLSSSFLVITILCSLAFAGTGILQGGQHPNPLYLRFGGVASVLLAFLAFPFAIHSTRQRGGAHDRMLGDLSFIVYMIHRPVMDLIHTGDGGFIHRSFTASLSLLVTLASSLLIWRIFDRPLNRLREGWVASRIVSQTAVP